MNKAFLVKWRNQLKYIDGELPKYRYENNTLRVHVRTLVEILDEMCQFWEKELEEEKDAT